jgi:hypothetical protein
MSFSTRRRARHDRILQFAVIATVIAMTIHVLVDAWLLW